MIGEFEPFISTLPTGVVFIDKNKKITYMNPYARDNIVGKEAYERDVVEFHIDESERKKIYEYFNNLSARENVELPIVKILNFKGKPSLFLVKLAKMFASSGEFSGIVAIFYDLSSFAITNVIGNDKKKHSVIDKLPVAYKNRMVFLNTSDIVFVRSIGSASLLFDRSGTRYFTNLKISELEESLSSKGFFRSHKSYLVNLAYLFEMKCNGTNCKLHLKAEKSFYLPISRRNKARLHSLLSIK